MAQNEVTLINHQLQQQFPDDYLGWDPEVKLLHESVVGQVRKALFILLSAVGFVWLIACTNVANLLLARAAARRKEMALRAALGASRGRLLRQLLTESALLAVLGGVGGVALAHWALHGLIALHPPDVPRLAEANVDVVALGFLSFTTLLAGIVFGMAPALHASKPDLNHALKGNATAMAGGGRWLSRFGLRDTMVIMQTALAVVLLTGAGLLMKSFITLRKSNWASPRQTSLRLRCRRPSTVFRKSKGRVITTGNCWIPSKAFRALKAWPPSRVHPRLGRS
jgi:predicted lysophospholipase L1 biosynthesis ABC-type transport system permease subunit